MPEEKILTLHPEGKQGVNIRRKLYDQVANVIIEVMEDGGGEMTFQQLSKAAKEILKAADFEGKPMWYITTVKLDLEARDILERVPQKSPQLLRFNKDNMPSVDEAL